MDARGHQRTTWSALKLYETDEPPNLATCGDVHHTKIIQGLVNAMGYMKFYERFETTNVTWSVEDIPCQIEEIPEIKFSDLESELGARETQIQGLNLDKILELMHQNKPIYSSKGKQVYAETKMLRSVLTFPYSKIASIIITFVNVAAAGFGVYTFFKMHQTCELIAVLYQSRLIKAQGVVASAESELPKWHLLELIIAIACIWGILEWVLPMITRWIVRILGVHYINVNQNPMVNYDYSADIYVKIKGDRRTEAVYLCTVNKDPPQISHTAPVNKPVIAMRGSCTIIRSKLIIQWHDLEVYNETEKKSGFINGR